jgi:hypothetical protein
VDPTAHPRRRWWAWRSPIRRRSSFTSASARKYRNIQATPDVAVAIGWDLEVTVQCEGSADILIGADHTRCLSAYFEQFPDGRQRAEDPDIIHVRIRPRWVHQSDYRPGSFAIQETRLDY